TYSNGEMLLRLLLQAADRFLIERELPAMEEQGGSQSSFFTETEYTSIVLSDYYSMEDCTRDTLIALPGLMLANRQYEQAARILRRLARYFQQGLLPDRL